MKVVVPECKTLKVALAELTVYKWQHGELRKRVMGIGQTLNDKPTLPPDPEDGKWPWYRIVGWKHYRFYLPRRKIEVEASVCEAEIRSIIGHINESELVAFIYLLTGKLYSS